MNISRLLASIGALLIAVAAIASESTQVTDEASAIAAAKRYTKARCTETPCQYRARREGKQWNVLVEFSKGKRRGEAGQRDPGGHLLLYFNQQGQLVRRVEGE